MAGAVKRCSHGALTCTECPGFEVSSAWFTGYRYTDEHIPTEKLGVPTAPAPAKPAICPCGIDRRDCDYHRD